MLVSPERTIFNTMTHYKRSGASSTRGEFVNQAWTHTELFNNLSITSPRVPLFLFSPHFDAICDLIRNGSAATWHDLFVETDRSFLPKFTEDEKFGGQPYSGKRVIKPDLRISKVSFEATSLVPYFCSITELKTRTVLISFIEQVGV